MKISISLKHIGPSVLLSKAGWLAIAVTLLAINNVSVRADLVAHWTFDEAGGTVAHDGAGGMDGTLSPSGAGFVTGGISSNAVSLSRAASGFVNMGNVLPLTGGDFSVVCWVKMNPGDTTPETVFLGKHEAFSVNGYFLLVNQGGGGGQNNKATFYAGGLVADGPVSQTSVNDGNWHLVVGVYKSAVNKVIYVDGVAQDTNSAPAINGNTAAFLVGGVNESGVPTGRFTGLIDDVQMYNHALSPNDILYLFQNPGKVLLSPPSILTHPSNQVVTVGDTATFSVAASGTPPLIYQWRLNGTNINGATASSRVITNVQFADAGSYSVVVSNAVDSVTSSNATLTVTPFPICVSPPSGLVGWWPGEGNPLDSANSNHGTLAGNTTFGTGRVGQGFVFDGNGDGVGLGNPANLQLQNFTIEAWVKRTSSSVVSLGGGGGVFLCYGSGGYAFGFLSDGRLFLSKVDIDETHTSVAITDTNFHHIAVTKGGATVVFYVDGTAYTVPAYNTTYTFSTPVAIGARGDNLTASFLGAIDELAVYNRALSASEIQSIYNASNAGKCAIPPAIVSQPESQTAPVGARVTFTVVAFGSSPLSYQWRRNGTNIVAATGTSLTLTNLQLSDAANYSVVVSNAVNFATSSNATLTVTSFSSLCSSPVRFGQLVAGAEQCVG